MRIDCKLLPNKKKSTYSVAIRWQLPVTVRDPAVFPFFNLCSSMFGMCFIRVYCVLWSMCKTRGTPCRPSQVAAYSRAPVTCRWWLAEEKLPIVLNSPPPLQNRKCLDNQSACFTSANVSCMRDYTSFISDEFSQCVLTHFQLHGIPLGVAIHMFFSN